jgi:hypothetical protein
MDPSRTADFIAPMEVGVPSLSATQYSDPPVSTPMAEYASTTVNLTELLETPLTATEVIPGTTRMVVGDDVGETDCGGTGDKLYPSRVM